MCKKLELENIVLVGRTFDEYYKMFDIGSVDIKNDRILDVASGVSSFCAEATLKGYNVTASDRIYCFTAEEIEEKCAKDLDTIMEKLPEVKDLYNWDFFKSTEDLRKQREKAYKGFTHDFKSDYSERYINTEYPSNNFVDNQFTIALISHFLFMYDELLDYEFHKQTIKEIIKITSKEIRIFPLVNLKGEESLFAHKLMNDKDFDKYEMKIVKVDYEFVKGGNEMLVLYNLRCEK